MTMMAREDMIIIYPLVSALDLVRFGSRFKAVADVALKVITSGLFQAELACSLMLQIANGYKCPIFFVQ